VLWDEDLAGARRFYSSDPWGNRIELIERLGAEEGAGHAGR
jgi:hypothetical protein